MLASQIQPWYHKGLRFDCTQCGKCCSGSPGYVFLTLAEAEKMAEKLAIKLELFISRYTRKFRGKLALKEKKINDSTYDCIFLKDKQCQLYETRPRQCKTYPWWPENLQSPEAWEELQQECEGARSPEAKLTAFDTIQKFIT